MSSYMKKERILLIAVKQQHHKEEQFLSSLDELRSLSKTAGGEVCGVITQQRERIHPATYIGSGKVEEIIAFIDAEEIDIVISNDELSSGQLRNLNDQLGVDLIDRSQLILDIFAQRAQTKEGQLQVELAQLEYTLPRLRGLGVELSRLGGGIGTRGPGETQLETDQRHIRRRIHDIKRTLETVVKQREQYRKRRKRNHVFQVAIVGYTNAGKSTIFNKLTESETLEEDQLFATLDPLTREIQLPSGFSMLMTDTVGFIQDLPTSLIAAFRSTLEEVTEADFILHVVDSSHADYLQHEETVYELLKELDAHTIPILTVYNKQDLLTDEVIPIEQPAIQISAYNEKDMGRLLNKIEARIKKEWEWYRLYLNPAEGKTLHQLGQESIITEKLFDGERNKYKIEGYIRKEHPLYRLIEEKNNST